MRSKTNFRDLPGLLSRAHRSLRITRDPGSGGLCVRTVGARPDIVGVIAEADESGAADLMLTLKDGQQWAELLLQLAALMHEREAAADVQDLVPGAQVTTRLQ